MVEKYGDPDRNRTCDLQIRNLPLYPTELRDHAARHIAASDRFAKSALHPINRVFDNGLKHGRREASAHNSKLHPRHPRLNPACGPQR
ncbi:hypothetical protein MES5069_250117 [Mesorhizobium escarrei]|uniref:Transposase n=1 Tax=Mesorhizobium escarrei TaxID=666018 RepID=A0ABN8JTT3_9HYPH|nr:hypothetical protein MES5069_250117 [Mesorhizobium escarrei]